MPLVYVKEKDQWIQDPEAIYICEMCKLFTTCQKNFDYQCKEVYDYFEFYELKRILKIHPEWSSDKKNEGN